MRPPLAEDAPAAPPGAADETRLGAARPRGWYIVLGLVVLVGGVLRAWHLAGTTLIWDEAFTGATARIPFRALIPFLRDRDTHPPLDYLLRSPLAGHTTSELLLRLPSAVASFAAVALVAWWLRKRQPLGAIAAVLMAVGAFQLHYAWQARPYALMVLFGVVLAFISHRWLAGGGRGPAVLTGLVLLAACFESETALFLAPGLFLLPGLRGDGDAWWWRGSVAGAALLWLGTWGTVLVHQLPNVDGAAERPYTTLHSVLTTVNELVDSAPAVLPLAILLVVAGGWLLLRHDRTLGRVWLCGFLVPVFVAAVLGFRVHLLWPKALAIASWGPMLAMAAAVDAGLRRWRPFGLVVAAAVALAVLPSTAHSLQTPQPDRPVWGRQVHALDRLVRPGDAVVGPSWLVRPVDWYFGRTPDLDFPPTNYSVWPYVFVPRAGPPTGRVWLAFGALPPEVLGATAPCAPRPALPADVQCLQRVR